MRQSRRWSSPANHPVQTRIGRSQALPRCVSAPRQDRTINWLKVLNSFADSLAGGVPIGADWDPSKYGDSYRSIKEIARNPAGIPVRCRFRSSHETPRWRKPDSNHRSRSEKSGRSETRASASCIAQPTGAAANDIGADDRQAAGDQIIATRLRRRSCR